MDNRNHPECSENPSTLTRDTLLDILAEMPDGGEMPLKVTGTSMTPFLLDRRSVVYLKKDVSYVPKRGDIVFFTRPSGGFVLHRVWKLREDGFLVINGDAQTWTELTRPEDILAHVTHFVRRKRDISAENRFYRLLVSLWMPLRPLHAFLARLVIYWHLLPKKLFPKRRER